MQRARGASACNRHVVRRRRRRTAVFSALLDARRPARCVLCSSRRTTTGARGGDVEHRRLILPLSSERVVLCTCGVAPVGCLRQCTHIGTCTSYAPSRWHLSLNAHRTSHVQLGITHFDPFLPAAQIPPLHMHPSPPQASLNSARRMHRPIMLSGMMRDRQLLGPEPPTRRRQPDRVGPEVDGGVDPWAPITSVHKGPRQAQRR